VIIGDDLMIPFYRVPDDAYVANESTYAAYSTVDEDTSTYAALDLGYIPTDDFYADHSPLLWRGRELYVPDLAIGRLVETPGEVEGMIGAFLSNDPLNASTAFIGGYDFLIDSAEAISDTLGASGLSLTTLINDTWNATQLQNSWLDTRQDLASINAHFSHWQAIPATGAETLDTDDVAATTNMSGTVNFSMGCHSGFSVHDAHAGGGQPLDFAQALAQKGAWWIGNTGYGYGMDDSIAFTEQVMHLFAQALAGEDSVPVGEALRWAKQRYLGSAPSGGFGTYDEKAMIEATLYGLPMYHVSVPGSPAALKTAATSISGPADGEDTISFTPSFQLETGSEYGDYYSIGGEVQANPGRPVQPRTSKLVPTKTGQTPHGAVLVSATSTEGALDPLISRPVTDTTLSEPPFEAKAWFPANPWAVNRLGDEPRLTIVPAQFQGDQDSGRLRRFTALEFQVYYTDTASTDFSSPVVWQVDSLAMRDEADFWVYAEDTSGIQRVVMAYTQDGSNWQSRDLEYDPSEGRWETQFTELTGQFIYFVQVVDGAGNVTITTNKGLFFEPTRHEIYMPLVMRNS